MDRPRQKKKKKKAKKKKLLLLRTQITSTNTIHLTTFIGFFIREKKGSKHMAKIQFFWQTRDDQIPISRNLALLLINKDS
jgi:hypothetical protein